jgi:hypothetical protein
MRLEMDTISLVLFHVIGAFFIFFASGLFPVAAGIWVMFNKESGWGFKLVGAALAFIGVSWLHWFGLSLLGDYVQKGFS